MMQVRRPPRLFVRLTFFAVAIAFLWPLTVLRDASETAVQASPFVTFGSMLAGRAFEAGAAGYVLKPYKIEELITEIKTCL